MYNFALVNADTDSIMVTKPNGEPFTEDEQAKLIKELNDMFPEHINWDEDGYFESVIVIKAKNYVLKENGTGKIKIKGSGLKDAKKEPAMKQLMEKMIHEMLNDNNPEKLIKIYKSYVKEALNIKDITRWCSKKTITESVIKCSDSKEKVRKNELDVWNAIKDEDDQQEGNKILVYPTILGTHVIPGGVSEKTGKPLKDKVNEITGLKLAKNWNNDHDVLKLVERCYATVQIFKSVIDMDQFIDYSKKKNLPLLEELKNETDEEASAD